jgi:hypothetical protein
MPNENTTTTIELEMGNEKVQNFRNMMRPFLTIFFSCLFAGVIGIGLFTSKLDAKEALLAIDGILGAVIGYHFGKSSKIDGK